MGKGKRIEKRGGGKGRGEGKESSSSKILTVEKFVLEGLWSMPLRQLPCLN